ncbi:hypothetical protein BLNAU_20221 [Blattamonas nauphoetae]|uniref:Uncharacterized protein n=1 Tax=Blattamonas nauphoetae TaxID=2049346 RepID=A0ABQ9WZY7_9EUKA|nr:hypothetical protein BLNAU_20221 [Blattamonas nauphoetae]
MFLRRFPQYLTVACLALSLLLFRHDQRVSTAMCADIAVFHLIGNICSFVGNDKTRLNSIMWIVWALVLLGVSVGVFFLSRTFSRSKWTFRPTEPIFVLHNTVPDENPAILSNPH